MPPRDVRRRMPPRSSRTPLSTPVENDPTLWPDEGSDTDPEYVPSIHDESDDETLSDTDDGSESEGFVDVGFDVSDGSVTDDESTDDESDFSD